MNLNRSVKIVLESFVVSSNRVKKWGVPVVICWMHSSCHCLKWGTNLFMCVSHSWGNASAMFSLHVKLWLPVLYIKKKEGKTSIGFLVMKKILSASKYGSCFMKKSLG